MSSNFLRNTISLASLALCFVALPACSDEGGQDPVATAGGTMPSGTSPNTNSPNTNSPNTNNTDNTGNMNKWQCDPVGANAEMNALINAPLAPGAVSVTKTPKHPGNPGPTGLPQ